MHAFVVSVASTVPHTEWVTIVGLHGMGRSNPAAPACFACSDRLTKGVNLDGGPLPLVGNRHYWRSDYHVHHRPRYDLHFPVPPPSSSSHSFCATTRAFSQWTFNAECVNLEGLQSQHLADGVNPVYVDGREYDGVFPVWVCVAVCKGVAWAMLVGACVVRVCACV